MYPTLWTGQLFGDELRITAYSLALVVATILTPALFVAGVHRDQISWKRAGACAILAGLAALVGARIWYWSTHWVGHGATMDLLLWQPVNFSLWGGLVAGGLAGLCIARQLQLPVPELADRVAPALAAGIAVLRLGCFARGCCFGIETTLPWGVTFPLGSPAHVHQLAYRAAVLFTGPVPVHPTQLYEFAAALVAGCLALFMLKSGFRRGTPFVAAAASFILFRGLIAIFRADSI